MNQVSFTQHIKALSNGKLYVKSYWGYFTKPITKKLILHLLGIECSPSLHMLGVGHKVWYKRKGGYKHE